MNSEERILKTLNHEQTDQIPVFESMIDNRVINMLYPGLTNTAFAKKMNLDAICVDLDYYNKELLPGIFIDEWGIIKQFSSEAQSFPITKPIARMRDLDRYCPPRTNSLERFVTLDNNIKANIENKSIILHLNDVFTIPLKLMGFQELQIAFWESPKLVQGLIDLSVNFNLELAKEAVSHGVKIIYTSDNYAYNNGPMLSVENFKKYLFPALLKLVHGYKDLGLYVIKRTSGNIMPIIDMIVESGIDCLDAIDPSAGMNLEFLKYKYGQKVALKGNVDCEKTLTYGTKEKVIEETRKCIETGKPGGGYILSSSNSIHAAVKPENFVAMLETHQIYGRYT